MSLPVKLSDHLVLDARLISGAANRSIAGQIEFWAGLGRGIEVLLRSPEAFLRTVGLRKVSFLARAALQSYAQSAVTAGVGHIDNAWRVMVSSPT